MRKDCWTWGESIIVDEAEVAEEWLRDDIGELLVKNVSGSGGEDEDN